MASSKHCFQWYPPQIFGNVVLIWNDVKKATRLIYKPFFSLFFLRYRKPWLCIGLLILPNYNHHINHILFIRFIWTIITFSLWFFSIIYPSIVENLYMNTSTGVPERKKNSVFSSFIWGDFQRLIINRTVHASIGLRLQYKVLVFGFLFGHVNETEGLTLEAFQAPLERGLS